MSDFPQLVSYLKRTAENAGYSMTVDRSMVLKLVAAAELAEAMLAHADAQCAYFGGADSTGSEEVARRHADREQLSGAYRAARVAR